MAERSCRVFLVDDHPVVISGVKSLIEGDGAYEVVGSAGSAQAATDGIASVQPDIVVVDGSLPGTSGIVLAEQLRASYPRLLILALSLHDEGTYIREFFSAGINGYVLKMSAADELLRALRCLRVGGTFIDPAIAAKLIPKSRAIKPQTETLSEREEGVIRHVAQGYSNKEISRALAISVKTVETYRARACEKLGIRTRAMLVRHALSEGWLASHMMASSTSDDQERSE